MLRLFSNSFFTSCLVYFVDQSTQRLCHFWNISFHDFRLYTSFCRLSIIYINGRELLRATWRSKNSHQVGNQKGLQKTCFDPPSSMFLLIQDKNINDVEGAKKKFTKLAEAYAVLSDDKKRADYDNPPPPPSQQNFSRSNSNTYQWKNPEFDPNFDHFKGMNFKPPKFDQNIQFPSFKGFQNYNTFKPFSNFSFQFGAFTFDMAE